MPLSFFRRFSRSSGDSDVEIGGERRPKRSSSSCKATRRAIFSLRRCPFDFIIFATCLVFQRPCFERVQ
jgi:hypothetical protein